MQRGSTMFLRGAIILIGLGVLALAVFVLPVEMWEDEGGYGLIFCGMYLTVVPFFVALYQTLKLLGYVDKDQAFSHLSVKSLKYIKYCAFIVSGMYAVAMPYIYYAAKQDDAPGVMVIGSAFTLAPFVIGLFAAVLQKLLQSAIAIKSENDLTV